MSNSLIEVLENQKKEVAKKMAENYVPRNKLEAGKKAMATDLIKVILGPRRAGKSIFSLMLCKDISFAYLNFEDDNLPPLANTNSNELLKQLFGVYGETKTILFDEIQHLDKWELLVNRLHRNGYNILLTGSNSKLLSKELATHLTGRHLPLEILPFDFKEFLMANNYDPEAAEAMSSSEKKGRELNLLKQYMESGGYPEVVVKKYQASEYLATLYSAILFTDVIKRYKVRHLPIIEELGYYLVNQTANEFSYRKISRVLNFKNVLTLQKYAGYLEEAYMFFALGRYSHKIGERLSLPKKIYLVDNGFLAAKALRTSPNNGRLMENFVFTELIKRGLRPNRELFYYKTRNQKEVDFIIKEDTIISELIQVAYDTSDPDTFNREVKALAEASQELSCDNLLILTWDREDEVKIKNKLIKLMPMWKWMLN